MDRSNIGVLVADPGFTTALGIAKDKSAQGSLMSIFLVCYGLSNFLAGPIVQRFGSKRALQVGILFWAILMAVMGAVSSIVIMLICRALLGVGESMLMPGVAALTQAWFPKHERSTANGIWYTGMKVAQVIATPVLAWWIYLVGWRGSFYILAVIGLLPLTLTLYHVYNHPSKSPRISKEEADYIMSCGGSAAVNTTKMDYSFVKTPSFWYITGVFAIANAGIWGFTTWVPSYLKATLGFSWGQMGALAGLPFVAATVWVLIFSPIMDKLNRRALIILLCLAFFAASLTIAMTTQSRMLAVAVLSLALAFAAVTVPAAFVIVQNITTQNQVATATGTMNGVSYVFASIAPYGMGFLYDWTGTLKSGFYGLSGMVVIAFFLCIPLVRKRL
jgi:sugar phosphate permease